MIFPLVLTIAMGLVGRDPLSLPAGPSKAEALALLRHASHEFSKLAPTPDSWDTAVDIGRAQSEAGDREGAKATFTFVAKTILAERDPDAEALLAIAVGMIDGGLLTEARPLLIAAVPVAIKDWDGPRERGREWALEILQAQVRAKDRGEREATLALIEKKTAGSDAAKWVPDSQIRGFHTRMMAWTAGGREELAFRKVGRYSVGPEADPTVAISILSEMSVSVRCRPPEEARPILGLIRNLIDAQDQKPEATAQALQNVARSLAIAGDFRQARALAMTIDSVDAIDYSAHTMVEIGITRTEHGDLAGARDDLRSALEIAEGFTKHGGNAIWYRLGHAHARVGDGRGVRAALVHLEPTFWGDILTRLATSERGRGDEKAAILTLGEAEKAVRLVLADVIDSTADRDLVAETQRVGVGAKNPDRFARDLGLLARIRAASGDSDSARIAIDAIAHIPMKMNQEWHLAHAQYELANGRAIRGDLDHALTEALACPIPLERSLAIHGAVTGFRDWKRAQKLRS